MRIDPGIIEELRSRATSVGNSEPRFINKDPDLDYDLKRKRDAVIKRYIQDTELRGKLATEIIELIKSWVLGLFVILFANKWAFHLSDTVLAVFLGTTTATVIGLGVIVLKGFFQYMD